MDCQTRQSRPDVTTSTGRASPAITGDTNYWEFRRLRLVADGTGYGVYDFRLQMTLEPETVGETRPLGTASSPDVKDAYFRSTSCRSSVAGVSVTSSFRLGLNK